jgi:hypothetical protein
MSAHMQYGRKIYIHEGHQLRHLNLRVDTSARVVGKGGGVANREGVRSLDGDLSRLASVQLLHALNLSEGHEVAVLEAVTGLIESCNHCIAVLPSVSFTRHTYAMDPYLIHRGDHTGQRLFAVLVNTSELVAKVVEDSPRFHA